MAKYSIEDSTLVGIADAIRAKEGTTDAIPVSSFASRVNAIGGGGVSLKIAYISGPGYGMAVQVVFEEEMTWGDYVSSEYNRCYIAGSEYTWLTNYGGNIMSSYRGLYAVSVDNTASGVVTSTDSINDGYMYYFYDTD